MAGMPLRAGAEMADRIAMERREVRHLKAEIFGVDRSDSHPYLREFYREYQDYQAVSSEGELLERSLEADLIYIGDFHALPESQAFAARWVERLARTDRPLTLAVEMLYGRDQPWLDRWLEGEVDEATFLARIHYHLEWGYRWEAFRPILLASRTAGIPVVAIDCPGREDLALIERRDACISAKLVDLLVREPQRRLVVIYGESHLAGPHLPARVDAGLEHHSRAARRLVIFQNLEEVYWRLMEEGREQVDVVRLSDDTYCVISVSPLIKYEAYRQTIEEWQAEREDEDRWDVVTTFHHFIDLVLEYLGLDKYAICLADLPCSEFLVDLYPHVLFLEDPEDLGRLLAEGGPQTTVRDLTGHLRREGAVYLSSQNAFVVREFRFRTASEKAGEFLFAALRGNLGDGALPRSRVDRFYNHVWEEALARLASRIIDPGRPGVGEREFLGLDEADATTIKDQTGLSPTHYREAVEFLLARRGFEREGLMGGPRRAFASLVPRPGARYYRFAHVLGSLWGEELFSALRTGQVTREDLGQFILDALVSEEKLGEACLSWRRVPTDGADRDGVL